jgi:hypothetical protein
MYSRLGNPTTDVLERRFALLSGAHEMGALAVASGTSATFNAIINLAAVGDNIVSSSALYGGTYTMFDDILPQMGIEVSVFFKLELWSYFSIKVVQFTLQKVRYTLLIGVQQLALHITLQGVSGVGRVGGGGVGSMCLPRQSLTSLTRTEDVI